MPALYIFEGIDEKKQLAKAHLGTFVHYHKHGEFCNESCFVYDPKGKE